MFGFPTRVRYLFHQRPSGGYDWPPEEGIVDRDLDLAISQFAPGAETVKDGLIHTSVGVVHYRPQGNTVIEQPQTRSDLPAPLDSAGIARPWTCSQLPAGMSRLRSNSSAGSGIRSDAIGTATGFQNMVWQEPRFRWHLRVDAARVAAEDGRYIAATNTEGKFWYLVRSRNHLRGK